MGEVEDYPAPEPSTLMLLALGSLVSIGWWKAGKRKLARDA
jgi:hypothetical protein